MPIIFLDIDGVLNRKIPFSKQTGRRVDHDLLARFVRLVERTGAEVVLASTWRHDPTGLEDARRFGVPFQDVLTDLRPQSRATEIEFWLQNHNFSGRYAVLDDDDDGYDALPLFQPDPVHGLSPKIASAVEAYLKGERRSDFRRNVLVRALQTIRAVAFGHRG